MNMMLLQYLIVDFTIRMLYVENAMDAIFVTQSYMLINETYQPEVPHISQCLEEEGISGFYVDFMKELEMAGNRSMLCPLGDPKRTEEVICCEDCALLANGSSAIGIMQR